jgi:uncharacterized membrane protein YdjX (TVP38/TMEM64 family)
LGRYAVRDRVTRKFENNAAFAAMDRAVAEDGWKIVLLTRLSPLFPFTLLNYAFGLTRVSLRDYVLASWIGMLPGTVMYVYLGAMARTGMEGRQHGALEWTLRGIGLIATVAVAVMVGRMARRALAKRKCSPA